MITIKEMQELENKAVRSGISVEQLMENAGKLVYETTKDKYELLDENIIILCGPGNNGGDGFVAARYFSEDFTTLILFFGDEERLSEEAKSNYDKIKDKVTIINVTSEEDLQYFHYQKDKKYIFIDALLGTGFSGTPREPVSIGINYFNKQNGKKVAIDIPSGMNADTGEHELCCNVDLIVRFHGLKVGLEKLKDKTIVVDIGIPDGSIKIEKV